WPAPWKASEMTPANMATTLAPSTPAMMPILTHLPRPMTPRVAAMTMPTIRPASRTSRKTMINAPSMSLFRDQHALGRSLIEFAEERITAGRERTDANHAFRLAGDHFFNLHFAALEFFGGGVVINYCQLDPLVGRHFNLSRRKTV